MLDERGGDLTICSIKAPTKGWIGPLAEALDPVFSDRIMGDGLLLDPMEGEVRAPCSGEVVSIARTKHAVTLRAPNGAEILMHVGIETVALGGDGFTVHVREGEKVTEGVLLLSFDLGRLADTAKSLLTPIVIANSESFEIIRRVEPGVVAAGDFIMELRAVVTGADAVLAPASVLGGGMTASRKVIIPLAHGIHARPAARLVEAVKKFDANVMLSTNRRGVNARSLVALMGLGARLGDEVVVSATGPDAAQAVDQIAVQIEAGLDETPLPVARSKAAATNPQSGRAPENICLDGSLSLSGAMGAPGLVTGNAVQLNIKEHDLPEQGAGVAFERNALSGSIGIVCQNLKKASAAGSAAQQDILAAHLVMLEDPTLVEGANALIEDGKSASIAWRMVSRDQAAMLRSLGDPRMAERAADLFDLESQILSVLSGHQEDAVHHINKGAIVIAEEILPSQFVRLAARNIAGICTIGGGPTSHVSILAAESGIPALVAADSRVRAIPDKTFVVLEADRACLHVAPTPEKTNLVQQTLVKRRQNQTAAREHALEDCQTADGVRIKTFANLGGSGETKNAVELGAEGCGLLRSEFLFLGRTAAPDEDEQLREYQKIANDLNGRPFVIRTLDIGGDKPAPYIDTPKEENPALGLRGVRISLRRPDLLKTQFRAILRVKSNGPLHIMLPMIVARAELKAVRRIFEEARDELSATKPVSLGVMIETPASAIIADGLAQDADFFSIGTNDLTQYVLAMDRGNANLATQIDSLHPAVLRLIQSAAAAGAARGKWVGVCGALASDLAAAPILIGLGITELSANAARLPEVKAFIRTLSFADCQTVAEAAIELNSPTEVRDFVRAKWAHLEEWA